MASEKGDAIPFSLLPSQFTPPPQGRAVDGGGPGTLGFGADWVQPLPRPGDSIQPERLADAGILEGIGKEGVAEQGAELAVVGEVHKIRVIDDDGARVGPAGCRIDDRLKGSVRAGGDHFRELDARAGGGGVQPIHQLRGDCGGEGIFQPFGEAGGGGGAGLRGAADLGNGAEMMDQRRRREAEQGGGDERGDEAENELAGGFRRGILHGFRGGREEEADDAPEQDEGDDEGEDGESGGDNFRGFPKPGDRQGGRLQPHPEADPCARGEAGGVEDGAGKPPDEHVSGTQPEDDQGGGAEGDFREVVQGVNAERLKTEMLKTGQPRKENEEGRKAGKSTAIQGLMGLLDVTFRMSA